MTLELKPLEKKLVEILTTKGEWLSRKDLAREMNRPYTLHPNDREALDHLVAQGMVEIRLEKEGHREKCFYRVVTTQ